MADMTPSISPKAAPKTSSLAKTAADVAAFLAERGHRTSVRTIGDSKLLILPYKQARRIPKLERLKEVLREFDFGGAAPGILFASRRLTHLRKKCLGELAKSEDEWRHDTQFLGAMDEFRAVRRNRVLRIPRTYCIPRSIKRIDHRYSFTVTVDESRKTTDYDDAIEIQRLHRSWIIRVHITDLTSLVLPGSWHDHQAAAQGFSVYGDKCFKPLFPISTTAKGSLFPQTDRPTWVLETELSHEGQVRQTSIHRGVMRSWGALTVQQLDSLQHQRNDSVAVRFARDFFQVAALFRAARAPDLVNSGSAVAGLDEYMIQANRIVARHLGSRNIQAPYRTIAEPEPKARHKIESLLRKAGLVFEAAAPLRALLDAVRQSELSRDEKGSLVSQIQRRVHGHYTIHPAHHPLLQEDRYIHFTSPIRRYGDFIAQGILAGDRYNDSEMTQIVESLNSVERLRERECATLHELEIGSRLFREPIFDPAATIVSISPKRVQIHCRRLERTGSIELEAYQTIQGDELVSAGRRYKAGDSIPAVLTGVRLSDSQLLWHMLEPGQHS